MEPQPRLEAPTTRAVLASAEPESHIGAICFEISRMSEDAHYTPSRMAGHLALCSDDVRPF
jgi:hypothetical protein